MLKRFCLAAVLLGCPLVATQQEGYDPLYAGTLLAYYAQNADPGRFSVEPYLFVINNTEIYTKHWGTKHIDRVDAVQILYYVDTGITNWLDVELIWTTTYNHSDKRHTYRYGDTLLLFGIQVMKDKKGTWQPDLRIVLQENFPTGKYKNFNPNQLLIENSGLGTYTTGVVLIGRKIFYVWPKHPFNWNLNLFYLLSTKTNVSGFNVYGGGYGTRGRVNPGNQFLANLAFEYSLTRNWAVGMDTRYEHQNLSTFKGKKGHLANGTTAAVGLPSSERISLAPCIEYNFSEDFSMAAGSWFTIAGRNSEQFVSYVANVFYYF